MKDKIRKFFSLSFLKGGAKNKKSRELQDGQSTMTYEQINPKTGKPFENVYGVQ